MRTHPVSSHFLRRTAQAKAHKLNLISKTEADIRWRRYYVKKTRGHGYRYKVWVEVLR